jgi:hypothetical protein
MRFSGLVVLGAAVAAAAVAGPSGHVPVTIQEMASGKGLCLTRPASFMGQSAVPLSFQPCSPLDLNPSQEWSQPGSGPNGFGEIRDARGDCIGPGGLLYQAGGQLCQSTALNVQWTRLSDGTVVDEEPPTPHQAPLYWEERSGDEPDPGSPPRLGTTADPGLAATFTFTALPAQLSGA